MVNRWLIVFIISVVNTETSNIKRIAKKKLSS